MDNVTVDGLTQGFESVNESLDSLKQKSADGITEIKQSILKTEVLSLPNEFKKIYNDLSAVSTGITSIKELIEEDLRGKNKPSKIEEVLTTPAKTDYAKTDLTALPEYSVAGSIYIGTLLEEFSSSVSNGINMLTGVINHGFSSLTDSISKIDISSLKVELEDQLANTFVTSFRNTFEEFSAKLEKIAPNLEHSSSMFIASFRSTIDDFTPKFEKVSDNLMSSLKSNTDDFIPKLQSISDTFLKSIEKSFNNFSANFEKSSKTSSKNSLIGVSDSGPSSYIVMVGSFKKASQKDIKELESIISSLNSIQVTDPAKIAAISSTLESITKTFDNIDIKDKGSSIDLITLNTKINSLKSVVKSLQDETFVNFKFNTKALDDANEAITKITGMIGSINSVASINTAALMTLPTKISLLADILSSVTSPKLIQSLEKKMADSKQIESAASSIVSFGLIFDSVQKLSSGAFKLVAQARLVSIAMISIRQIINNAVATIDKLNLDSSKIEKASKDINTIDSVFKNISSITKSALIAGVTSALALPGLIPINFFLQNLKTIMDAISKLPDISKSVEILSPLPGLLITLNTSALLFITMGVLAPMAIIGILSTNLFLKMYSLLGQAVEKLDIIGKSNTINIAGVSIIVAASLLALSVGLVAMSFSPEIVLPGIISLGIMTVFIAAFGLLGFAASFLIAPMASLVFVSAMMLASIFILNVVVDQLSLLIKNVEAKLPKKSGGEQGGILSVIGSTFMDAMSIISPLIGVMLAFGVLGLISIFLLVPMLGLMAFSGLAVLAMMGMVLVVDNLAAVMKTTDKVFGLGKSENEGGVLGIASAIGGTILGLISAVLKFSSLIIIISLIGVLGLVASWALSTLPSLNNFSTSLSSTIPALESAVKGIGTVVSTANNVFSSLAPKEGTVIGDILGVLGLGSLAGIVSAMSSMMGLICMFLYLSGVGLVASKSVENLQKIPAASNALNAGANALSQAITSSKKLYELAGSKEDMKTMKKTFDSFDDIFKSFGKLGKTGEKNAKNYQDLESSSKLLGKSASALTTALTNINQVLDVKTNTGNFKLSIEDNIAAPLMGLDKPISKLEKVTSEVKKLNTELTKLSKDNRDTLKGIGSIGEANEKGISVFVAKLESSFKKFDRGGGSSAVSSESNEELLKKILEKLTILSDEATKKPTKSWMDKGLE